MDELEKVVTASDDKTIKVFDYPSFKECKVLKGHTNAIGRIIKLDKNRILSASLDKTVKMWNSENGICQ